MSTVKTATRLIAVFALSLLALFTSISAASAHDQLIGSSPKAGATIEEAPKEITLEFSGELQSLSGVDATVIALTRDGQQVQTEAETKGTKVIVTPSEELAGGKYSWLTASSLPMDIRSRTRSTSPSMLQRWLPPRLKPAKALPRRTPTLRCRIWAAR